MTARSDAPNPPESGAPNRPDPGAGATTEPGARSRSDPGAGATTEPGGRLPDSHGGTAPPQPPDTNPSNPGAPAAPGAPGSPPGRRRALRQIGPGILIAATGVGAGDVVAAAVSGSRFGYAVVWAVAAGAVLKYVINEGLARWQLATGTTLVEGWTARLGKWVQYLFLLYLIPWSFVVGGALISACGLAAHAVAPALPIPAWGAIHSLAAVAMVILGGYARFEQVMKLFIGVMFLGLVGCALAVAPPTETLSRSVAEAAIPPGGVGLILGVIGGIGGSVTLLSYGYWMREKGWEGRRWKGTVRTDLGVAYTLTGIFGLAVIVLAAQVLYPSGAAVQGSESVLGMAGVLGSVLGPAGAWAFRIGFWAAVTTSILGVWQGIPYLFCDFVGLVKRLPEKEMRAFVGTRSPWYRGYLLFLSLPPLTLLIVEEPVVVIVLYAAVGALFMPFLAGTLLYMNSRAEWVGRELKSGWITNALLLLCLLLFGYLGWTQIASVLGMQG